MQSHSHYAKEDILTQQQMQQQQLTTSLTEYSQTLKMKRIMKLLIHVVRTAKYQIAALESQHKNGLDRYNSSIQILSSSSVPTSTASSTSTTTSIFSASLSKFSSTSASTSTSTSTSSSTSIFASSTSLCTAVVTTSLAADTIHSLDDNIDINDNIGIISANSHFEKKEFQQEQSNEEEKEEIILSRNYFSNSVVKKSFPNVRNDKVNNFNVLKNEREDVELLQNLCHLFLNYYSVGILRVLLNVYRKIIEMPMIDYNTIDDENSKIFCSLKNDRYSSKSIVQEEIFLEKAKKNVLDEIEFLANLPVKWFPLEKLTNNVPFYLRTHLNLDFFMSLRTSSSEISSST